MASLRFLFIPLILSALCACETGGAPATRDDDAPVFSATSQRGPQALTPEITPPRDPRPNAVVFSFESTLRLSQWAEPFGDLQQRLNDNLSACGKSTIVVDNKAGPATARAIARLRECPGFDFPGEEGSRALTEAMFTALWPHEDYPDIAARAGVFTANFEGTDYDRFIWNVFQAADPASFGTWGPFGATLGHGGEIQAIIADVARTAPGEIVDAFAQARRALPDAPADDEPSTSWRDAACEEADRGAPVLSGARLLLAVDSPLTDDDKENLKDEFCADARFRVWYGAFDHLAERRDVRAAYDRHYAEKNRRVADSLARLYREAGLTPTQVDWAFFLDRSTQFSVRRAPIVAALQSLPAGATPAERRLAVSRASRPGNRVAEKLRVGRDMAFIVDALGEATMTTFEKDAWTFYGRRRASQIGLSDDVAVSENPF